MGLSQYMSADWVIGDMGHSYRGSQGSIETHKQTTNKQCFERGKKWVDMGIFAC